MDERLKLSDKQKSVVNRLRQILHNELADNNISMVHHSDSNFLYFFNGEHVSQWDWAGGLGEHEFELDDCEMMDLGAIACAGGDHSLLVDFFD